VSSLSSFARSIHAALRTGVFLLKVLPMLPSRPLDFITPAPIVEKLEYPTASGAALGDVYRPSGRSRHAGVVVCLGVVPFGVDHPQVPRLGKALARSGFAALMYWSPAMRDFRLDPEDIENIARAYTRLTEQPYVDRHRSGLLGTCVGGSFALMASASATIRDRVAFVCAFAPYGSLLTLAPNVASGTRESANGRRPWNVDPLTRKVFVHSVTARLPSAEAARLRNAFEGDAQAHALGGLSPDGVAVQAFLLSRTFEAAERGVRALPLYIKRALDELSPTNCLPDIQAPLVAISHDRDDEVIPVDESRRLVAALGHRSGVRYAEFAMFEHADPTKRKISPLRLLQQLSMFYRWLHAVFRAASG
jgi:hypothetical protein